MVLASSHPRVDDLEGRHPSALCMHSWCGPLAQHRHRRRFKGGDHEALDSLALCMPPPQSVDLPHEFRKLQRMRHRTYCGAHAALRRGTTRSVAAGKPAPRRHSLRNGSGNANIRACRSHRLRAGLRTRKQWSPSAHAPLPPTCSSTAACLSAHSISTFPWMSLFPDARHGPMPSCGELPRPPTYWPSVVDNAGDCRVACTSSTANPEEARS